MTIKEEVVVSPNIIIIEFFSHYRMTDIDRPLSCPPLLKVVGKDYPGLNSAFVVGTVFIL